MRGLQGGSGKDPPITSAGGGRGKTLDTGASISWYFSGNGLVCNSLLLGYNTVTMMLSGLFSVGPYGSYIKRENKQRLLQFC